MKNDTFYIKKNSIGELKDIFEDTNLCVANMQFKLTWEIIENKLYLVNIEDIMLIKCDSFFDQLSENTLNILNRFKNKPSDFIGVFAKWVSKPISIRYGGFIPFERMGSLVKNYSKYEKLLYFNEGELVKEEDFENIDLKSSGLSEFEKQSLDSIIVLLNKEFNWADFPRKDREFIIEIFTFHISKEGHTNVTFYEPYDEEELKAYDLTYINGLNKILQKINWKVISTRNIPTDIDLVLDIKFDIKNKIILNPYYE